MLAHVAMAEGVRTVEAMVNRPGKHVVPINYDAIPGSPTATPRSPRSGRPRPRRASGHGISVGKFPFSGQR